MDKDIPVGVVVASEAEYHAPPVARVVNVHGGDESRQLNGESISAHDVTGCWCTLPLMGTHCYGLQSLDRDTLVENPPECCLFVPLPTVIGRWFFACDDCHPKQFHREPGTNIFKGSDGLVLKFYTDAKMTSNNCGHGGCPCGHPRSIKLFCMPSCMQTALGCLCCTCL